MNNITAMVLAVFEIVVIPLCLIGLLLAAIERIAAWVEGTQRGRPAMAGSLGHVFLLTGYKGAGKDTAAEAIVATAQAMGLQSVRTAIARRLKEMTALLLHHLFDFPLASIDLNSQSFKAANVALVQHCCDGRAIGAPHPITARQVLQVAGTEVARLTFGNDVWVRAAIADVERVLSRVGRSAVVVITDCRFPDEVQAFRDRVSDGNCPLAGFRVHVVRVLHQQQRNLEARSNWHVSETAMDEFPADTTLHNDFASPQGRQQLRDQVVAMMEEFVE